MKAIYIGEDESLQGEEGSAWPDGGRGWLFTRGLVELRVNPQDLKILPYDAQTRSDTFQNLQYLCGDHEGIDRI